ncbi:Uncharacterised protein [Mycobacteroides abscessus]|nr:Uncharacterised protein [Mycobacteroides abscessus]
MALRLTGSNLPSSRVRFSNTVLTSRATASAVTVAPGRSDESEGFCGARNSTDLAPKTVVPAIRTVAFEGIRRRSLALTASSSLA